MKYKLNKIKCRRWEAYPPTLRCTPVAVTYKPRTILVSVHLYVAYKVHICERSTLQRQNNIYCCQY